MPLILLAWAPVVGSTKLSVWFTYWWVNASAESHLQACHSSVMIVVPGFTQLCIMGKRVAASCVCTTLMKMLSEPLSISLSTHLPSHNLPLLYLRLPNLRLIYLHYVSSVTCLSSLFRRPKLHMEYYSTDNNTHGTRLKNIIQELHCQFYL